MSMTREQMLHYMENPDQLNEKTLVELKEILEEYPYFQSAHLLYVRNLLNEKNFRFAAQLKISAIHATDRTVLYSLLNISKKEGTIQEGQADKNQEVQKSREERRKQAEDQIMEAVYRLEGDIDSGKSLAQLVKEINETATKHRSEFIRKFRVHDLPKDEDMAETEDHSLSSDEFITETLAKIYIKQGLYHKAIDAFQRLKLKYPEKSIYFARQIDEVSNLLNK